MKLEGLCSPTEAWFFYYGWSRVYELAQPYFTSNEMREAGLELAEVKGPLRVLDVGAGTGTLSVQVAARCSGSQRLTLLDQSAQMLDQARAKPALAAAERFVIANATAGLPFDDDSFDRVVSSGVFYYFPNPVEALREQMRVVRPGGRVLVMGSLQPKPWLVRVLAETFNRFPTEKQYEQWFSEAGLSDVTWRHISNPWNAQQYAIAIVGTKAQGTPQPERLQQEASASLSLATSTLGRLTYLPLALIRFALALAAFSLLGPLQIATAMSGMRRLRRSKQA